MSQRANATTTTTTTEVKVEETMAATPLALYGMVSDVTNMGRWSPETTSCRWLGGATEPAVGARFRGVNRQGWRRWFTTCTVVEADPGRRFAFDADLGPLSIARWAYDFAADGDGCVVTESWTDRRAPWMARAAGVVMSIPDRAAHNREGMGATLVALREAAEASSGP